MIYRQVRRLIIIDIKDGVMMVLAGQMRSKVGMMPNIVIYDEGRLHRDADDVRIVGCK